MFNLNFNLKSYLSYTPLALILLALVLFSQPPNVSAGDPGCQNGNNPVCRPKPRCWNFDESSCRINRQGGPNCYCSGEGTGCPQSLPNGRGDSAAAQIKYDRTQPPAGGLTGSDSPPRSMFSAFVSLAVPCLGIWTLFVLIAGKFRKRNHNLKQKGRAKLRDFIFQPSFALGALVLLFLAAIAGSILTAPVGVSAGNGDKSDQDRNPKIGAVNPSTKPVFKSAAQVGGAGTTQIGAPVFDQAGNRYISGGFTGAIAQNGTNVLTATLNFDAFVAKYDVDNNLIWARQGSGVTGSLSDSAAFTAIEGMTALTVDAGGSVYVGGSFVKTLTLQGGANPNITLNDAGGAGVNYESFVAKYDAGGNLLWAKGGASGSPQNANNLETGQNAVDRIVVDLGGNVFVTGFVSGSNFLNSSIVVSGQTDIVLAKLDGATGSVIWKQVIGGTDDDNGLDLKTDGSGNLYVIGNYGSASITFPNGETFGNPDNPNDTLENSTNTFIAKFNASGNNLWVNSLDNAETVGGTQIAVNGAGEIFLTGYFFDTVTFGTTTLVENEGDGSDQSSDDERSFGGYLAKIDTNGNYLWAKGFGGQGEGIALDAAGRAYVVGVFWDSGVFGAGTPTQETLASFDESDSFVARYDTNGNFHWAKQISGSGVADSVPISNPDPNLESENEYKSLSIAYNPARGTMFVANGFFNTVALDCLTLKTAKGALNTYLAELSADDEPVNCRIWNGLDPAINDWDAPANWNGGIIPNTGDSVYVPFTGNNDDAPTFNPANNVPLAGLTIADDRTLTLEQNISVNSRLDLNGGHIDAGDNFTVLLGAAAQASSIANGRVLGKVQKQFAGVTNFTFPVGTINNYSPVTLSNIAGTGNFAVTAHEGQYPNPATNLPANRAARWWNLTDGGLTQADLTFQYAAGDITSGTEENYRAFRIPTGGGAALQVPSSINTNAKTVDAPNITEFSDWTLAQRLAPTAATVAISGKVTAERRGVAGARVSITDANGHTRTTSTNLFGSYRFADVIVGSTYIFEVKAKRLTFVQQVININQAISNLNFTGKR